MSDLHLEVRKPEERDDFWRQIRGRSAEADTLVLAGDVASLRRKREKTLFEALQQLSELYQRVFYVPGNHEFWGTSLRLGWQTLRSWESTLPKVVFLRSAKPFSDGSVRVAGDTLWYADCGDPDLKWCWCDYQAIDDSARQIQVHHEEFLAQESLGDLCVTHHFPTRESIAKEWAYSESNVFFCAYLEDWLQTSQQVYRDFLPRMWIHGHTHNPMDYKSRLGFRVYCNPLGYPREGANPRFWERLLVDTDPATW